MLKSITLIITIFFTTLLFSSSPLHYDNKIDNISIKSASELDYPPFSVVTEEGKADGFSVELLKATLNVMDRNVTFYVDKWSKLKADLSAGNIDVLPVVGRTKEREKDYDFTVPYLTMHGAVFTREDDKTINSMSDMAGKELVVMNGDNAHEYLLSKKITKKIITLPNYEEAFKALSSGKYDAVIIQKLVGIQLIKQLELKNIKVSNFILSDFEQKFTFAVKDGNKELLSILNEGLSIVVVNGTFTKLYEKWFYNYDFRSSNYELIVQILITILLIFLILITLIYSWNKMLQKKVNKKTKELDDLNSNLERYQKKLENDIQERTLELEAQKNKLETIFHTSKDGVAIFDLDTKILDFNISYLEMTGFSREELLTKSCLSLSVEEDIERVKKVISTVLEKGYYKNFEKSCIVNNNKRITTNMSLALMPNKKEIIVSTRDITEEKKIDLKLKEYVNLIDNNIISSTCDLNGVITKVSNAFCGISGYSKEELLGKTHKLVRSLDTNSEFYKDMWKSILSSGSWKGEIKNRKKNGDFFWVKVSIFTLYNDENNRVGFTSINHNITDQKYIEELSITDALTGIYNRRYFNEMIVKCTNISKRKKELLSFMIMDIDFFKQYNDTYGHQMGDEVLQKVSSAIKSYLNRSDDYCFRLGGEEFGVIFRQDNEEEAIKFANKIKNSIEDLQLEHSKNTASKYITISIGLVTMYANDIDSTDALYKKADDYLYKAKENGRNRIEY